jgi:hypothetical protein
MENTLSGETERADKGAPPSGFSHDGTGFESRGAAEQAGRPRARENSSHLRESFHHNNWSARIMKSASKSIGPAPASRLPSLTSGMAFDSFAD